MSRDCSKMYPSNILVDAVSFTEAEARIYDMLGSVIRGDFQVTSIGKEQHCGCVFFMRMWMYGTSARLPISWQMQIAERKKR